MNKKQIAPIERPAGDEFSKVTLALSLLGAGLTAWFAWHIYQNFTTGDGIIGPLWQLVSLPVEAMALPALLIVTSVGVVRMRRVANLSVYRRLLSSVAITILSMTLYVGVMYITHRR